MTTHTQSDFDRWMSGLSKATAALWPVAALEHYFRNRSERMRNEGAR